jgi:hypothetical protein
MAAIIVVAVRVIVRAFGVMRLRGGMLVAMYMYGSIGMAMGVFMSLADRRVADPRMRVGVLGNVCVRMGMLRSVCVDMGVLMHVLAFNSCFSGRTAASGAHVQSPSRTFLFDFEFLDPHFGSASRLYRVTAAVRAGVVQRRNVHRLATIKAQPFAGYRYHFQLCALSKGTVSHRIETEAHRIGFNRGQFPDFDKHCSDAGKSLAARLPRSIFDDLQHAFGKRHFMHFDGTFQGDSQARIVGNYRR